MVEKMLKLLVWIFIFSQLPLKARRSNLKIYGLIFEKKEKFGTERLILKFTIFQKSAMEFLIHLFQALWLTNQDRRNRGARGAMAPSKFSRINIVMICLTLKPLKVYQSCPPYPQTFLPSANPDRTNHKNSHLCIPVIFKNF